MKCKACSYSWNTKTKLIMISCPSCGTKNKVYHLIVPQKTRREAFKRAGNKCETCGSKKFLELHHIIPNLKTQNHKLENLKVLCHGCHTKIRRVRR